MMTLFQPARNTGSRSGWIFLTLFFGLVVIAFLLPTGYVIERPGATFDVMGETANVPVIDISGAETFESESRFDVVTVSVVGNQDATPNWFEIISAWINPEQIVLPVDEVFPPNRSTADVRAESVAMMEQSQQEAIAAALTALKIEVPRALYISSVTAEGPASQKLVAGDFIREVEGNTVFSVEQLREQIQQTQGKETLITVSRDGMDKSVTLRPEFDGENYLLGVLVGYTYEFPLEVSLQLGNVGGPSGGLMFALGIFDQLTPGSLALDNHVVGTGTITSEGSVGPIGGIRLKMLAAQREGADLFLAPLANCSEVVGNEPEELLVVPVADLEQAIKITEEFSAGVPVQNFPSCS